MERKAIVMMGAVILGGLLGSSCSARLYEVEAKVAGVDCKYCAHGLETLLKTIDGVANVTVNVKKGTATLALTKQNNFDVAQVGKKLEDSKFELSGLKLTASGSVDKKGQNYLFSVSKSPYKVYLHKENEPILAHVAKRKGFKGVLDKVTKFVSNVFSNGKQVEQKIAKLHDEKTPALLTCSFHQHTKNILGATGSNLKLSSIKTPKAVIAHEQHA